MTEGGTGWEFAGQPAVTGSGIVTLVEGSAFCVGQANGDITDGGPQGLFFRDTRILSRWRLTVNGRTAEPLVVMEPHSFEARFVARTAPAVTASESSVLIERCRLVGVGMREDVIVRNLSPATEVVDLVLSFDADFADLFEVKERRVARRAAAVRERTDAGIVLSHPDQAARRGVLVKAEGWTEDEVTGDLRRQVEIAAHGTWVGAIALCPIVNGMEMTPLFASGTSTADSSGNARLSKWIQSVPIVETSHAGLSIALRASIRDLGALRIFDPADPDYPAIAAGAPWFMALFGRDSLISSYLSLLLDQNLALGTLRALARRQGRQVNESSEEQPGRVLHEIRTGTDLSRTLGGGDTYYGTADATPLFVVLLGELSRWGLAVEHVEALLPHADRALDWVRSYGDADGDGFVEYQRSTEHGLANQGWKDSWDGVNFADGRLPEAPIALAEVQGYVYAAYQARAALAERFSDHETRDNCLAAAATLKSQFNEVFWLPDDGYYAMALDRDKQPVDALGSNMGHCLWSGIIDDHRAADVVARLMGEDMFTGWGIRTLSSEMARYNPMSYHNGSVWPHDNALIASGFRRYGFVSEVQRLSVALIEASESSAGRLPELFCGFPRRDFPHPVPYPTSCSPQAWAAATPVHLLRVMLGIQPDLPAGSLEIVPHLAPEFGEVRLDNLPLDAARIRLRAQGSAAEVSGVPFGVAATAKDVTVTFRIDSAGNAPSTARYPAGIEAMVSGTPASR